MQKSQLLLVAAILILWTACAKKEIRDPLDFTLSQIDARKELSLAKEILYKAHPSLYLYKKKEDVDVLFDSVLQTFTARTSIRHFYNSLYSITNELGCSHTDLLLPAATYDTLRNRNYFFPFPVLWINDKMLVNVSDLDLYQGTEILSINGKPVKQLLNEISFYNSIEGFHRTTQLSLASRDFSFQYYLKYGPQEKFSIRIADTAGKKSTIDVKAINYSEWESRNSFYVYYFDPTSVEYDLSFNATKSYAYMRIPTFDLKGLRKTAFENFCENSFELLYKKPETRNLIIDLRENTGGDLYCSFLLFSYITKKPFIEYERVLSKINSIPLSSYLDADFENRERETLEKSMLKEFKKKGNSRYYYYDSAYINNWDPKPYQFTGNVFVITNSKTMSAASYFALLAQKTGSAKLVGDETSGGSYSGNGFTNLEYVLPGSGIKLFVPYAHMIYSYKEEKNTGHGVIPDYLVPDTYESFKNNEDKQVRFIADSLILN